MPSYLGGGGGYSGGGFGPQRSAAQRPPQQARPQRPQRPQQPPAPGNQLGGGTTRQTSGRQNASQQANALGNNYGAYGSQAAFDKALSDAGLVSQTQARRQMDIWRRGYNSPWARRR